MNQGLSKNFQTLAVAALLLFLFSNVPYRSETNHSVEVGFSSSSPAGPAGGLVIPASCPSNEHSPGECYSSPYDTPYSSPYGYPYPTPIPSPTIGGGGGSGSCSTFCASPATITVGDTSVLSFSSTNATSCSINQGVGSVPTSGTVNVSPAATTTFTLTCTGPGGTVSAQTTVRVLAVPSFHEVPPS